MAPLKGVQIGERMLPAHIDPGRQRRAAQIQTPQRRADAKSAVSLCAGFLRAGQRARTAVSVKAPVVADTQARSA